MPIQQRSAATRSAPASTLRIHLTVNGVAVSVDAEPCVTLLDLLRDKLQLTGTKKGCDHGQCGACTVLVDGERVLSCLTLGVMRDGCEVTTVEGLGLDNDLHPLQRAFVAHDALQCGYCTPGQLCSAVGLISEGHARTMDDVRELMSGNLCRCGAYVQIVRAVSEVALGSGRARSEQAHEPVAVGTVPV